MGIELQWSTMLTTIAGNTGCAQIDQFSNQFIESCFHAFSLFSLECSNDWRLDRRRQRSLAVRKPQAVTGNHRGDHNRQRSKINFRRHSPKAMFLICISIPHP